MQGLRYIITATIGEDKVYWGGRNDKHESLWFTNIEDAYKVPGRHYMNIQAWWRLPDRINHLDNQPCSVVPAKFEVEEHWIDV